MRHWALLAFLLCGCGVEHSPIDGFWRADYHTLTFSAGGYESGDLDGVGTCREAGTFELVESSVVLSRQSAPCEDGPRVVTWTSDELHRPRSPAALVYRRDDPRVAWIPPAYVPPAREY